MTISTDVRPLIERARKIGLKQTHVGEYSGIGPANVSRAANGLQILSYAEWRQIERTIASCEEIQRRAPGPIDWRDARAAREMIAAYEAELKNPAPPLDERDWQLLSLIRDENMTPQGMCACLGGISLTELGARMSETGRRMQSQTYQLRAWNQDTAALTALRDEETERLRVKNL